MPTSAAAPTAPPRVRLTLLDWLLFGLSIPIVLGCLIALAVGQRWQLAVVAACTSGASAGILWSRYRRRTALAMRAADPGDDSVARAAATVHLQEAALTLLAIGLLFAAGGVFSTLH